MRRSHFKHFFETYFNYPYEKLELWDADCVRKEIATSYECTLDEVDCFFLFSNPLTYRYKEIQHYGFYRIKNSDFYVPFFAHCSPSLVTAHVEMKFNYDINNSVFDFRHVPLKKERTREFYELTMENIQPFIRNILSRSGLLVLDEQFKKSSIYFDFDFSYFTLEVAHRGHNFNESFAITYKNNLDNDVTDAFFHCRYYLRYCLNKKVENLQVSSSNINLNNLLFNKDEMLHQSFSGMNDFGCFEYTTIDELDTLVKEYRKVEKMYII
jgi:hypothetical protein